MAASQAIKIGLFFIIIDCAVARKCIACTHEPSSAISENFNCIGDLGVNGNVTIQECNPEYGDQACYTMVTCDNDCYGMQRPNLTQMKWNRGCCNPEPNHQTCPTNKPNHVDNGWFSIWRVRCTDDVDGCNTAAPGGMNNINNNTGGAGGGDGVEGGDVIIVPPKGATVNLTAGFFSILVVLFIVLLG